MAERVLIKTAQEWGGSYDEIHDVIYRAHEQNRKNGIYYRSSLLDGEGIKNKVGKGATFVAIKDNQVIGTGSVSIRKGKYWYDKGLPVAHFCLDAVLPEYQGKGIMKAIDNEREKYAVMNGARLIRSGTAEKNIIQNNKFKRTGFVPVDYLVTKGNDYYSVMYAKWLDESVVQKKWKCKMMFIKSKAIVKLLLKPNGEKTMIGKIIEVNSMQNIKNSLKQTVFYRYYVLKKKHSSKESSSYAENRSLPGAKKRDWANILYDIPNKDYYQCRCYLLPFYKIREIVPYKNQRAFYKRVNSKQVHDVLCDKYICYKLFKPFYKRDVVLVNRQELSDFEEFRLKHSRFNIKPLSANCGKGIQIIDSKATAVSTEELLSFYSDGFIAEELIVQNKILARFHPSSVNTLRINTVSFGNSVEIKWPCLRIGCGNSIVDNAGAGGVFGAIDVKSGIIISVSDEFQHTFEVHPDTGVKIVGFQIPLWEEACNLAKKLATLIPEGHFIGWDLALTDNGWVMVEGNYSPLLIWQIAVGKGIKKEFSRMKRFFDKT